MDDLTVRLQAECAQAHVYEEIPERRNAGAQQPQEDLNLMSPGHSVQVAQWWGDEARVARGALLPPPQEQALDLTRDSMNQALDEAGLLFASERRRGKYDRVEEQLIFVYTHTAHAQKLFSTDQNIESFSIKKCAKRAFTIGQLKDEKEKWTKLPGDFLLVSLFSWYLSTWDFYWDSVWRNFTSLIRMEKRDVPRGPIGNFTETLILLMPTKEQTLNFISRKNTNKEMKAIVKKGRKNSCHLAYNNSSLCCCHLANV